MTFRLPRDLVEELDRVTDEATAEAEARGERKWDRTRVVKTILTEYLLALREERAAHKSKR